MEASVPSLPVIVERVNLPELTDEDVGRSGATEGPGSAGGLHTVSAEGDKLSPALDSHCLKVTFNSESPSYGDDRRHSKITSLSKETQVNDAAPSKDDVLSVVIQKLTELVNDSEKLKRSRRAQSDGSSGKSSPSNSCCDARRAASPKRTELLHKCQTCPCLFTLSEKQLQSKEKPLCNCCEKSKQAGAIQKGDTEEETVGDVGCSSDEKPAQIKCELCNHIADSYVNLLYHLSEHKDAKIFKCKLCDFFTTVQSRILSHASVHNATHVYKCSSCTFVTGKLTSLQRHMKNHNRVNELLLKCSECGFSCRCEEALRNHMWEHVPADLHTSSRTPAQNTKESRPMSGPLIASSQCKTPTADSAQVLLSQTTAGEQSYIFKCLLCGYLCDRLATLKAHAWRHAGEIGCSYPIVDENDSLVQSLTKPCKTPTPSESKLLPEETENCSMLAIEEGKEEAESSCDIIRKEEFCTEEIRSSCGCGSASKKVQEDIPSCRCVGINIPPSSAPLIKEFLIHKKCEISTEKISPKCDDSTKNLFSTKLDSDSAFIDENQVTSCRSNCSETGRQIDSPVSHPSDSFKPDSYISERSREQQGLHRNLDDHQMILVDPDIPVPEPAANVEAITEHNLEKTPEEVKSGEDPFIPSSNLTRRLKSFPFSDLSCASVSKMDQNEKKSESFRINSKSKLESDLTISFNQGRKTPLALREHVDAACSMMALTSQEIQAGSINTVSYINSPGKKGVLEKVSVLSQGSHLSYTINKLQQKLDLRPECIREIELQCQGAVEVEGENTTRGPLQSCHLGENAENKHQISKQNELTLEEQTHKISDSTVKRKKSFGHEGSKGKKRVCMDEQADAFKDDSQSVIMERWQNHPNEPEGSSEIVALCDTDSEEDSVVKFFMSILEDCPEPFLCKLCTKAYKSYPALKQHLQTHLVHNSFRCPLCKDCFDSLDSLKCHIQEHYEDSYSCSECSAFFYNKSDLQTHRESHRKMKEFRCDVCDVTFSGRVEFIRHQETIHCEKSLVRCTHCGEQFGNTNTLLLHTLRCEMRKMRCCKECSFSAETVQALQNHVRDSHTRNRFYKCTLCDYKSSAKNGIKNHMKFHATERPYKCHLCSFMGAYPQSLRSHMRMHNQPDWRPDCLPSDLPEQYKCKFCCYTCNYLPSLKSHMWRHASDPNYNYKDDQDADTDQLTTEGSPVVNLKEGVPKQGTSSQTASASCGQGSEMKGNIVTFCCQECGFQSTDRDKLVDHLKMHLPQEVSGVDISREDLQL